MAEKRGWVHARRYRGRRTRRACRPRRNELAGSRDDHRVVAVVLQMTDCCARGTGRVVATFVSW